MQPPKVMKPIIGVTPDFNAGDREDMGGKEPTYFLRARYLQAIEAAGGVPLILPLVSDSVRQRMLLFKVDGLLVTGSGSDLSPGLYGEPQRFPFRVMSAQRAELELGLSKLAFRSGLPTLGICGGMQSMNVGLGGTLFQDISGQLEKTLPHQPPGPATKPAHAINIVKGSRLHRIMRLSSISVNSSHHQSVKTVPRSLITSAVAPDGVIEAIESPTHPFFVGVQWHPEFLYDHDPLQKRLFHALIHAAKAFASA